MTTPTDLAERLARLFEPNEVRFKPQAVKGNRALAVAYVDVRTVQERLDEAVGPENWQDEYQPLPDGSVLCHLRIRVGGEWVTKSDVGSPSEQPDAGDRLKAAVSDALKRTAIKWGIGRYLYRIPQVWWDYDPQRKQFATPPQLPAWALPARQPRQQQPARGQLAGKPAEVTECDRLKAAPTADEFRRVVAELNAANKRGEFTPAAWRVILNVAIEIGAKWFPPKQLPAGGGAPLSPADQIWKLDDDARRTLNVNVSWWLVNRAKIPDPAKLRDMTPDQQHGVLKRLEADIKAGIPFQ